MSRGCCEPEPRSQGLALTKGCSHRVWQWGQPQGTNKQFKCSSSIRTELEPIWLQEPGSGANTGITWAHRGTSVPLQWLQQLHEPAHGALLPVASRAAVSLDLLSISIPCVQKDKLVWSTKPLVWPKCVLGFQHTAPRNAGHPILPSPCCTQSSRHTQSSWGWPWLPHWGPQNTMVPTASYLQSSHSDFSPLCRVNFKITTKSSVNASSTQMNGYGTERCICSVILKWADSAVPSLHLALLQPGLWWFFVEIQHGVKNDCIMSVWATPTI